MTICEMGPQDVDAVTKLEESCFSQPWRRHDFEEILTNPGRIYLVAKECDEVIGGCMLTEITGEGDISNVAVKEQYRGKHIATKLCINRQSFHSKADKRFRFIGCCRLFCGNKA